LIVQWYKSEGEWVGYGDDLFEMRVEEIKTFMRPNRPKEIIRSLNNPSTTVWNARAYALLRITSSDIGILRRIYVKEGMRREVGDLLAVLTTDEKEPFEEASQAMAEASRFRVVTNVSQV